MNNNHNPLSEWQVKKLGEVGRITGGSTPSTKVTEYWNGDIPWLTPSEVTKNESIYIDQTERYITQDGVNSCGTAVLPAGTVMMTSRATIGYPVINTVPMATNQGFINIIPNEDVSSEYLTYWIMQNRHLLMNKASGVTFKELSKSSFKNISIPLPPARSQEVIVRFLSSLKASIEKRELEISTQYELKDALVSYLFTYGARKHHTKKTEIGEQPESWKFMRFGELASLKNGINFKSTQKGKGILTVDVLNMYSDSIYVNTERLYRVDINLADDYLLKDGDVLFVRSSLKQEGVGWSSLFRNGHEPTTFCGFIIRARLTSPLVNSDYLIYFLRFAETRRKLISKSGKVSITNINQGNIASLIIPLPTIEEQAEISSILKVSDETIATMKQELLTLKELFGASLNEIMRGKLSIEALFGKHNILFFMSERTSVQNPMLKYAQEIGWEYIKPEDAMSFRGGDQGLYFTGLLEAQLLRLNPGVLNKERAQEVVRQLTLIKPSLEGNQEALRWLRGEKSVFVPEENRERNVKIVDFENPQNNIYQVTDEWWHKSVVYRNRADVMFLINGMPIAIAETKSAEKVNGLSEGVDQIRRYHRETPEMLTATQVFEVTQLLDFFYGVTWNTTRKNIFNWKDAEPGSYERKIKAFFDHGRFLKILKDYILFLRINDELVKVILRQHQTRAVEKTLERVAETGKRRGLIWHTQGSGKTLTMITVASKLLRDVRDEEKPTVLMLVDRNELESKTFNDVTSYGITNIKLANSKKELQEILGSDYRGLILSMIYKFDDIPANLNTRENVIVLVDEAHRTTSGDLGNYLMAALPNATYIGFTGTPIDKIAKGKGTFKVFGVDDEQGYLDKYSIAESIEDGTTVQLNYALAPSNLRVDKETLDKEFLGLTEAEGMSDPEELTAILDRAVTLKEIMKAPDRVEKIAQYVAQHFKENVEPMGFKAFLVGVDREACVLYKKALDKHLPSEYSRVVYSAAHNDPQELKDYYLSEEDEVEVRKAFTKKKELPKILIVTEKLLTGFDAPILYCMYLDKPMRDHVLLQAIARVNRPYEDDEGLVKPFGFILDFVGIFERLEKALSFDSDVVGSVIQNIDELKERFSVLMEKEATPYITLAQGLDDKAKEAAIEYFTDKEKQEEFFKCFRQIENLYEVLSPDQFLHPYIEKVKKLAELYALIRNAYSDRVYVDHELTSKTKLLLQHHTSGDTTGIPGEIHELGVKELAALKQSENSDDTKIINLRKALVKIASQNGASQPYLVTIGERAEALAKQYEDRQLVTKQALSLFLELADEYIEADKEREELSIDPNTFAVHVTLKQYGNNKVELAQELNNLFETHTDYQWNEHQRGQLRLQLYKILRPIVGSEKMIEAVNNLMKLQRV